MAVEYVGEQLLPGKLGEAFVICSFVSALVAAGGYFFSGERSTLFSRRWFYLHCISVAGVIGTLFYLIVSHRFEYHYVWQHSSKELPLRYMLSSFWEGQEGSFLLWSFWHVVLGLVLVRLAGKWEAPVVGVFALVQAFISSMLLGVYVAGYKVGSNPFLLLREHPDMAGLPFLSIPTYLESLNGRGLNPLLQNYWMTIHPPTLFLGFAATLVPFAYAIAGLVKKNYVEWIKPALPWTFFGIMILGTGILMGGAWAYEALSFGGFWAWDPVENSSLVPWLVLLAAGHLMIVQRKKPASLLATFIFTLLSFLLVLYSTFLTRSGILGDTSVHAFTDLGMSGQLLVYLLFFVALGLFLIIRNYRSMPRLQSEESLWSREFWMFLGALILFISAFQITITTSIPVINKVFGTEFAPPLKPIDHYNSWQVPFATLISILAGATIYFKYRKSDQRQIARELLFPALFAVAVTAILYIVLDGLPVTLVLLLFTSLFALIANVDYTRKVLNGNVSKSGAAIAHAGFALILIGALISTSKSNIISKNSSGVDISSLGKQYDNAENIMLSLHDTVQMGEYWVVYRGKHKDGVNLNYHVDYLKRDNSGKFDYAFTLLPRLQLNDRMGPVAEPDTRHFFHKDIYSHITYADLDTDKTKNPDDYREPSESIASVGDTIFSSNSLIRIKEIRRNPDALGVTATLEVKDIDGRSYEIYPSFNLRGTYIVPEPASVDPLGLKITFDKIDPSNGKLHLSVYEKNRNAREFIIMKAIVFPGINILWLGCVVMIAGTLIAIRERIRKKASTQKEAPAKIPEAEPAVIA